jgi:hypothetical protein
VTGLLTTPRAVGSATVPLLVRAASRVRGERVIHPRGTTRRATLTVTGAGAGARLLDEPRSYDAVVRLSRSAGLPRPLPDVLGLAVRVVDCYGPGAHQDLLLDTGASPPLLRRLPLPRWSRAGMHSSLLGFDVGGSTVLLGGREVARDRWELCLAEPHGPWRPWAELLLGPELRAPMGRQLRFDPWNTGPDLRPAGILNRLRRGAYEASHVGPDA